MILFKKNFFLKSFSQINRIIFDKPQVFFLFFFFKRTFTTRHSKRSTKNKIQNSWFRSTFFKKKKLKLNWVFTKGHNQFSYLFPSVNKIERWLLSYKYRRNIHLYRIRPNFRALRKLHLSTYFRFNKTYKRFRKSLNPFVRIYQKNVNNTFFIFRSFRWLRDIYSMFYIKKYIKRKTFKRKYLRKKFRRFFLQRKRRYKDAGGKFLRNVGILKSRKHFLLTKGYSQIFLYKWYRNYIFFPTLLKKQAINFFYNLKKKVFVKKYFFLRFYYKSFLRLYLSKFSRKNANFFVKGFFFIKNLKMSFFFLKPYLYKISPKRSFNSFYRKIFFFELIKKSRRKKAFSTFLKFFSRAFATRFFSYAGLRSKFASQNLQNSIDLTILSKINNNYMFFKRFRFKRKSHTYNLKQKNNSHIFRLFSFTKIKRKKKFFLYYKKLVLFKPLFLSKYGIKVLYRSKVKNRKYFLDYSNYKQLSKKGGIGKTFDFFESLLSTVIVNLFRCKSVLFSIRLIKQGAIFVNSRVIFYPKYSVRVGDLVSVKLRYILLNMRYFKFRPYGFFLQMQLPWKFAYFSITNLKIFAGIFYRSFQLAFMSFNQKLFSKRWLIFFFFFIK